MSEMSSRFDWFSQLTAERLAQASGNAPTSETGAGLLPLNLVDEHQLRMALDALGVVIDAEPICLLDPHLKAHGTGTSLGGPIEIDGMQSAFSASLPASTSARCGVGSVNSNIEHLESAAGLAGVLKVVAPMAHRRLPASIHVTTVNSRMSLLDDLAISEEIRHYPDHERSTNFTGMW